MNRELQKCKMNEGLNARAAGEGPFPEGAQKPGDHLRKVFYRMGLNDQEIVALSGTSTIFWVLCCDLNCFAFRLISLGLLCIVGSAVASN